MVPTSAQLCASLPGFWKAAGHPYYALSRSATIDQITEVERVLGRPVPADLRWLWSITNGINADFGNTDIHSTEKLIKNTRFAWDRFKYPDEVIVVGNDGSAAWFVLWVPRGNSSVRNVALQVSDLNWESGVVESVAIDLLALLWCRHSYYGWMYSGDYAPIERRIDHDTLNAIAVAPPSTLGVEPLTQDHYDALKAASLGSTPKTPHGGWSTAALRDKFGASVLS